MSAVRLEWRREFAGGRKLRGSAFASIVTLSCEFAVFLGWFAGGLGRIAFCGTGDRLRGIRVLVAGARRLKIAIG